MAVKHAVLTYEADPKTGQGRRDLHPAALPVPRRRPGRRGPGRAVDAGDEAALAKLLGMLTPPKPGFPIVTRWGHLRSDWTVTAPLSAVMDPTIMSLRLAFISKVAAALPGASRGRAQLAALLPPIPATSRTDRPAEPSIRSLMETLR